MEIPNQFFWVNLFRGLIGYQLRPNKPSIGAYAKGCLVAASPDIVRGQYPIALLMLQAQILSRYVLV